MTLEGKSYSVLQKQLFSDGKADSSTNLVKFSEKTSDQLQLRKRGQDKGLIEKNRPTRRLHNQIKRRQEEIKCITRLTIVLPSSPRLPYPLVKGTTHLSFKDVKFIVFIWLSLLLNVGNIEA